MSAGMSEVIVPRSEVDAATRERLFLLFTRYYGHVDRAVFDRDLAEKDWVFLLLDDAKEIRGFSSIKLYDIVVEGRPLRAAFSGNTIIDRDCWGQQELVKTWLRFMARLKMERPDLPLYWYLISSGYRTYLLLHVYFRVFYPRYDRETPPYERRLIDTLGRMKYPDEYSDGVVRVSRPREVFRPDLAVPTDARLQNPHVRFFVERNPGYLRGDELVCITEWSLENTLRLAHSAMAEVARSEASAGLTGG